MPGVVGGFEAVERNSSAILVQWGVPSEPNGIITQYEVEYTLVNGSSEAVIVAVEYSEVLLTDLEIFSEYDIRVRAYTSVGPGIYTDSMTIRTDPFPATPPVAIMTTPTERTIRFEWNEPMMPNGMIEGYYISTNATPPANINMSIIDSDIMVLNVSSDVLSIYFTGLVPFTYYEFSVAAYSFHLMDTNNNFTILTGEFSDVMITRTDEDCEYNT